MAFVIRVQKLHGQVLQALDWPNRSSGSGDMYFLPFGAPTAPQGSKGLKSPTIDNWLPTFGIPETLVHGLRGQRSYKTMPTKVNRNLNRLFERHMFELYAIKLGKVRSNDFYSRMNVLPRALNAIWAVLCFWLRTSTPCNTLKDKEW